MSTWQRMITLSACQSNAPVNQKRLSFKGAFQNPYRGLRMQMSYLQIHGFEKNAIEDFTFQFLFYL